MKMKNIRRAKPITASTLHCVPILYSQFKSLVEIALLM